MLATRNITNPRQTVRQQACNPSVGRFTPYRHYRLVLDTIGEKLEEFRSSQALVKGMYAALQGRLAKHW